MSFVIVVVVVVVVVVVAAGRLEGVMTELWLISVPLDKTTITNVGKLKHIIAKTNLASCFMFSVPDLTVSF